MNGFHELLIEKHGQLPYGEAVELQKKIHAEVFAGTRVDTLLICAHPPVITVGTSTKPQHLTSTPEERRRQNLETINAGRGGSVTYHGPEQLIAYPIINLRHHRTDVGWYMRTLEEVIIRTLTDCGITGKRIDGKTGVWVQADSKIAFIGVKISRWCTYHGISLNVFRCAESFKLINPCGLGDIVVTSIEEEAPTFPSMDSVITSFIQHFASVFRYQEKV